MQKKWPKYQKPKDENMGTKQMSDRISSQKKENGNPENPKNPKIPKNWKFINVGTWNISHISSRLVNVSWVVWPSTYHKKNVDWWIAVMKGPWHTSIDLFLWCISNQGNLLRGIVNFSCAAYKNTEILCNLCLHFAIPKTKRR